MCKFTNRLFVFVVVAIIYLHFEEVRGSHVSQRKALQQRQQLQLQLQSNPKNDLDIGDLLDYLNQDYDYDLHYDQRQKGEENLRLKLDGFVIGLPPEDMGGLMTVSEDFSDTLAEALFGSSKNQNQHSNPMSSVLPDYKLNSNYETMQPNRKNEEKPPALVVQIPAPKKDVEARYRSDSFVADDHFKSRTKYHMNTLLNLLRRSRRN